MFPRATRSTYVVLIRLQQLLITRGYASIYGYELLHGRGGDILHGPTTYKILQRLEEAGFLEKADPRPGCPPQTEGSTRVFYRLTREGKTAIPAQIRAWRARFHAGR